MRIKKFKKNELGYVGASYRSQEEIEAKRCEICPNYYEQSAYGLTYQKCKLCAHKQYDTIAQKGVCKYYGQTLEQARTIQA